MTSIHFPRLWVVPGKDFKAEGGVDMCRSSSSVEAQGDFSGKQKNNIMFIKKIIG